MGTISNVSYDKYPLQGDLIGKRVFICFDYDTEKSLPGTVIRDDAEEPHKTIIRLDDGRIILSTECQYRLMVVKELIDYIAPE